VINPGLFIVIEFLLNYNILDIKTKKWQWLQRNVITRSKAAWWSHNASFHNEIASSLCFS